MQFRVVFYAEMRVHVAGTGDKQVKGLIGTECDVGELEPTAHARLRKALDMEDDGLRAALQAELDLLASAVERSRVTRQMVHACLEGHPEKVLTALMCDKLEKICRKRMHSYCLLANHAVHTAIC